MPLQIGHSFSGVIPRGRCLPGFFGDCQHMEDQAFLSPAWSEAVAAWTTTTTACWTEHGITALPFVTAGKVSWLVPFNDAHLWKCIRSTVTRRWVAWDRWQPRSRITHSHLVLYALILCCSCQEIQLNQSVVIICCGHPILIQIYHVGGDKCRIWRARTADSMATDKR